VIFNSVHVINVMTRYSVLIAFKVTIPHVLDVTPLEKRLEMVSF